MTDFIGLYFSVFAGFGFLKQIHRQANATIIDAVNATSCPAGIVLVWGGVTSGVVTFDGNIEGVIVLISAVACLVAGK